MDPTRKVLSYIAGIVAIVGWIWAMSQHDLVGVIGFGLFMIAVNIGLLEGDE